MAKKDKWHVIHQSNSQDLSHLLPQLLSSDIFLLTFDKVGNILHLWNVVFTNVTFLKKHNIKSDQKYQLLTNKFRIDVITRTNSHATLPVSTRQRLLWLPWIILRHVCMHHTIACWHHSKTTLDDNQKIDSRWLTFTTVQIELNLPWQDRGISDWTPCKHW